MFGEQTFAQLRTGFRVCVSASLYRQQGTWLQNMFWGLWARLTQAVNTITICTYKSQNQFCLRNSEPQIHVFSYTYVYSLSKCSFILVCCAEVYGKMWMDEQNNPTLCPFYLYHNRHLAQILLSRFCCPSVFHSLVFYSLSYETWSG